MGILDSLTGGSGGFGLLDDPRQVGLMNVALGLLSQSGPSTTPTSFGQALGRAGMLGMQGMQDARDSAFKRGLLGMQADHYRLQNEEAQRKIDSERAISDAGRASMLTPEQMSLAGGGGPTVANAAKIPSMQPGFDTQGFVSKVMAIDPIKGIALQQSMAKETPFGKIDPKDFTQESIAKFAQSRSYGDLVPVRKMDLTPGGQVVDLYNAKPGQSFLDPNKPFAIGAGGQLQANLPYQAYELGKAKAGATNVSVNTEKNLLNDIAGGLGRSLVEARGQAQAAAGTIQTLGRLSDALNSGNILAGPGASFKQFGLQIGSMIGVNGKDANEKLLNTRQAVQSLAQLELDSAQQMKGQGQITEAERAIIKRAAAGDIDSMTAPELKLLTNVLDRSARYKIKTYNAQVAPLKGNKNASVLTPFLDVQEPAPLATGTPSGGVPADISDLLRKYGGQ